MTSVAPRPNLAGAGLVALAATCFGTLGPITRFAAEAGVGPLAIVTWRAAIGGIAMLLLLGVLHRAAGRRPLAVSDLPVRERWFVGAGGIANLFLNLAMFVAFVRIEIGLALLLFYAYPGFVALASVAWFGERLDGLRWGALGLSMLGLVLTLAGAGDLGSLDLLGIGLSLMAGGAQAFYVLAARHGFGRIPPVETAAATMSIAAAGYLVIAIAGGSGAGLLTPLASPEALVPVVLAGVIGAAIPTVAFITGIRILGAPRAAILATLEPVVGVVLAAILLAEQPAVLQLVGGALILVAAVLLQVGGGAAAEHEAVGVA